jgi:hypothetical protein
MQLVTLAYINVYSFGEGDSGGHGTIMSGRFFGEVGSGFESCSIKRDYFK